MQCLGFNMNLTSVANIIGGVTTFFGVVFQLESWAIASRVGVKPKTKIFYVS